MLTKQEAEALRQWYGEAQVLDPARKLIDKGALEELEEWLQMTCLFPLSRHDELPEYLKNDDGKPLFPTNLNPKKDLEKWQDAIEVGWQVLQEQVGVTREAVHRRIAKVQKADWNAFIDSVEQRKKERGKD